MDVLSIDIETYSSVPIKHSVYKYVESPDFEILLFGYSFNGEPVKVIDMTREELPARVLEALHSSKVLKTAYNAAFEITCLKKYWPDADYDNWQCTMILAAYCSLPFSLEDVAEALLMESKKDSRGKALINYFSIPCKPTKANGQRTRNLPKHAPDKWKEFIQYCAQDVLVEYNVRQKLISYNPPQKEWDLWSIDRCINEEGVAVELDLVKNAMECDSFFKEKMLARASDITDLENPNSIMQLKEWFEYNLGEKIDGVTKSVMQSIVDRDDVLEDVREVARIRLMTGKTSIKKYEAMLNSACDDGRCRGMFQYYGASRTARWSGRIVQLQNLPRNYLPDLDEARELLLLGDYETLELLYEDVSDVLSQLIRTALVPSQESRFIVADFSAIEARVIAWLAGEKWRQKVFATTGKIYEASASMMFHVPVERIKKGNPEYELRQKGKVAELALGYQGGPNALISMGALKQGLAEEELPDIVTRWRSASPSIVKLWKDVETAALKVLKYGGTVTIPQGGLVFFLYKGALRIKLPSGRCLTYMNPSIGENRFGRASITYKGLNQKANKWGRLETYGGKLVENIVQAVARDCLAWAMERLHKAGYKIVAHVHDEVIIEAKNGEGSLDEVIAIMCRPESWNKGLLLTATGFESSYYMKD